MLDTLSEEEYKDATLLMQLLRFGYGTKHKASKHRNCYRDSVTSWAAAMQESDDGLRSPLPQEDDDSLLARMLPRDATTEN